MTSGISEHYRELAPEEIASFAERVRNAWQDAAIPERQWNLVVKKELEAFRRGEHVRPYDVLISCLKMLPRYSQASYIPTILDVGASSGYYGEVLRIADYECCYTAYDFSPDYRRFAEMQFPGIDFEVGNATELPFLDGTWDIVLHSACIMHCYEWQKAISEAARIADSHLGYVIFHRTPIADKTTYFAKEAYGVECLEIHFNQDELFEHFHAAGLKLIGFAQMGLDMKSFVMAKEA